MKTSFQGPSKANIGGFHVTIASYGYDTRAKYELFKVRTTGSSSNATNLYFVFGSATTETDIKAKNNAGSSIVPTACAGMNTSLPTPYALRGADNPTGSSTFTGSYRVDLGL